MKHWVFPTALGVLVITIGLVWLAYARLTHEEPGVSFSEGTDWGINEPFWGANEQLWLQQIVPIHGTPYVIFRFTNPSRSRNTNSFRDTITQHIDVILDWDKRKRIASYTWINRQHYRDHFLGMPIRTRHATRTRLTYEFNTPDHPFVELFSRHSYSRYAEEGSIFSWLDRDRPITEQITQIHIHEKSVRKGPQVYDLRTQTVPQTFAIPNVGPEGESSYFSRGEYVNDDFYWKNGELIKYSVSGVVEMRYPVDDMLSSRYWQMQNRDKTVSLDAEWIPSRHGQSFLFYLSLAPSFPVFSFVPDGAGSGTIISHGESGAYVPLMAMENNKVLVFHRPQNIEKHLMDQVSMILPSRGLYYKKIRGNELLEDDYIDGYQAQGSVPRGAPVAPRPYEDEYFLSFYRNALWAYHYSGAQTPEKIFPRP